MCMYPLKGLEGRACEKMSVPLAALQRRKSLPVRTSVVSRDPLHLVLVLVFK